MKKEVPTATPLLKSMCRITTRRLVAAQTMHRIRHGSINGYPCRHAYLSLSGSRSPKFVEIPKKSSRREVSRNPVHLVSREQLYRLEHLRPFRWNSGQVRLCCQSSPRKCLISRYRVSFLVRATKCSNSPATSSNGGKGREVGYDCKGEGPKRTREDIF